MLNIEICNCIEHLCSYNIIYMQPYNNTSPCLISFFFNQDRNVILISSSSVMYVNNPTCSLMSLQCCLSISLSHRCSANNLLPELLFLKEHRIASLGLLSNGSYVVLSQHRLSFLFNENGIDSYFTIKCTVGLHCVIAMLYVCLSVYLSF